MKNFKYISTSLILALFCFILVTSCKEEEEELSISRQFSPSKIAAVNGETQVTIAWSSSLFTTLGEVSYAVEISDNVADFTNPVYTTTVSTEGLSSTADGVGIVVSDDKLAIKKDYYARVKAVGTGERGDSNWLVSGAFRILGEQFLLPVTTDNIIDQGVRLYWRASSELTKIVLTPASGAPIEVDLSDADRAATFKIVSGLTQNTSYTAEIFGGAKTKGTQSFKTKLSFTGNVVDLTGTTGNPGILLTTLTSAPSGSTIVLRRGENYTIPSQYTISKSVMIVSGMDYGTGKAIIRSSASFTFAGAATIDSVVFKDLIIRGGRATSYGADYLINSSGVGAVIGKVRLENCTVKILRGVVRGQAGGAGTRFTNLFINNSVIDSIADFSVAAASGGSSYGNIQITNTTLYKARKFILLGGTGVSQALTLENCTFNEAPSGGAAATTNYFIDLGTNNSSVSIKNCIIGKVWNETGVGVLSSGFRSGPNANVTATNSYFTSDFTSTSPVPNLSSYSGASTALFTDPGNGNFKFLDANFIGKETAGDPRWR